MIPNKTPYYEIRTASNHAAHIDAVKGIVDGYPIVFNERASIGDLFYEEIAPHACDDADITDVKFLINHNDDMIPLARHRRGKRSTMDIEIDDHGVKMKTQLDVENNSTARELCSAIIRGDIDDMSFRFGIVVEGDEWSDLDKPMPIRRITKIAKIAEFSAVNDGAYPQTEIHARSAGTLENEKKALDNARAAALDNEKRAAETAQAALRLEIEKILFLEEQKQ